MADFKTAVLITIDDDHEGGYVDNPNDKGGPTKYGITQADMPGRVIKDLTPDDAIKFYSERYWKPMYSQINDQGVGNKLFDMGVLFGVGEAAYLLQRALNFLPDKWTKIFDQDTLDATNASVPSDLLKRFKARLLTHATNIINANPNDHGFRNGWDRRIES